MKVYLFNIFLIVLWGIILLRHKPSETKKKIYCGIVALQWILISGLRSPHIGADTLGYYAAFEREKNTSWSVVFSRCIEYLYKDIDIKDPGYYLIQKIFQVFSDSYQAFLIFIAIVFTVLMARWIYKYSSMPEISFLIYSVLFYSFYAVTGHRQTLATALIVFLGYDYVKEKKFLKFAIVSFIAFMIHKSSIVFVIYYFIANINLSLIYVSIVTAGIGMVTILGNRLYIPIAYFLGFHEEQIEYDGGGAELYATVLLLVCAIAFVCYPWINKRIDNSKNIYNMLFLTILSTLLVYQNQTFMRVQQYYSLVIMIVVPEIIISIEKEYRQWAYVGVVSVLVLYLIKNNPQYMFFWQ